MGAEEQWTGWQVHFYDKYFARTFKLSLHVKILHILDEMKQWLKHITAEAGRLRYNFVLALAELNTWSFV